MASRAGAALVLLLLASLPAQAHDVKDPVCRMMTDTDTTPYRETVGGKTYFFCSDGCKARFDKAPAAYVTLNKGLASGQARSYRLVLDAPPRPVPGRPTLLSFAIHEDPTGRVVQDFEVVHTKPLHFLIVSADMAYFEHQHPKLGPDGRFRLLWTFPRAGRYFLFADFTPADGDNQILRTTLDVGRSTRTVPPRLVPDVGRAKVVGDTRVTLAIRPDLMRAGRQSLLTYTLSSLAGRGRTDMQPILGVMGHLIALRGDTQTLVHTHALHSVQAGSYGAAMLRMMQAGQTEVVPITPAMVTLSGPRFTFKLTLPRPGRYRLWAQFQRQNRWLTVPFTVDVHSGR